MQVNGPNDVYKRPLNRPDIISDYQQRHNIKLAVNTGRDRNHRLTKSHNFDSICKDSNNRSVLLEGEQRTSQGNIIALACGPLKKKRYINHKIELELVDFKKEIEEKFEKSPLRRFVMPLMQQSITEGAPLN